MSDTITTPVLTTERAVATLGLALPVGSRLICTAVEPHQTLAPYIGNIGKVVAHRAGGTPQVEFEVAISGSRTWWVNEWIALPERAQRVTVTSTLEGATPEFKAHIIGREVTFHEAIWHAANGTVDLRVSDHGFPDCPDVLTVTGVSWTPTTPGEALGDALVATAEAQVAEATALSRVERERQAQRKYAALVEGINTLAENQEWCGEFESWAQDNDVEVTRSCEKEYSVDITLTYTLKVEASDVEEQFKSAFGGEHWNVDADEAEVEVKSTVSIIVTSSTEPSEMDDYDLESYLRNDGYDDWDSWEVDDWTER